MAKRYLISTAGYPNFGDEQIVRTWLKFYRENFPDDQFILDVPFPARASFLFQDELPHVQFVDTIWNLVYLAHDQQLTLENESEVSAILHGGDPRNNVPIAEVPDAFGNACRPFLESWSRQYPVPSAAGAGKSSNTPAISAAASATCFSKPTGRSTFPPESKTE